MNFRSLPPVALWIFRMFGMAVVYCVAGRLALLLAIPPGYATAVWPAAGVALAGVLLFGYRLWPGILIGSFFVNIWTSLDSSSSAAFLKSISVAAGIGGGAALQAVVGAYLLRRFAGYPNPLVEEKPVIQFVVLGGAVSCLVSPTIGVSTLWAAGIIAPENCFFSWWTWWVGDAIGVILFAPLVLIWSNRPRRLQLRRRLTVSLPLAFMFALAVLVYVYASQREQAQIQRTFQSLTDKLTEKLRADFDGHLEVIEFVTGLYGSVPEVTREQFTAFAQPALARHSAIRTLEWISRVLDAQRADVEEAMRQGGYAQFKITERDTQGQMVRAASRANYYPTFYVEPRTGNERALGFDLGSHPARLAALNQARDTGRPVATGRILLAQETNGQSGFAVLAPVYEQGFDARGPAATTGQRREKLRGFAVGAFRVRDLIETLLYQLRSEGIELQCYDAAAAEAQQLFYSSFATVASLKKSGGLQRVVPFEVAGHPWRLAYWLTPAYLATHRSLQSWAVLAGSLGFTGLAGAFLLVLTGRTATIEQLVVQRTAELANANAELAKSNQELDDFAYIASHDLKEPLRGIHNYSQFLLEDCAPLLPEDGRAKCDTLMRLSRRMESLIEALLYFSRVGRDELAVAETDLQPMLTEVLDSLDIRLKETGVAVRVPESLPTVRCDSVRVREVFYNLVTNAMKYNDKAEKWVEIGWRETDAAANSGTRAESLRPQSEKLGKWENGKNGAGTDGLLAHSLTGASANEKSVESPCPQTAPIFYVRDNGIGIRGNHLQTMFRIFKRLHGRDKFGGGTGIGLTIAKKIVERHGGRIWVESTVGEGTAFYFTLQKGI